MKNKLLIIIIILLPILPMIAGFLILIYPTIEDRSLNREKMYYDLGEGYKVTVMLKDSLAYIMPYKYESCKLPSKDFISFVRDNNLPSSLTNKNDQYIAIYIKDDNELIIGPKWNIDSINMINYQYKLFGDYKPISFRKRINPKEFETSENLSAITNEEKEMLDSLSQTRYFSIVSDGKPLIMQITRINDNKVTSRMYRGYKEDKNMSYVIKE